MSNIKFSSNLFLEEQELNRFAKFLDDDGWRLALLKNSISFGLVNNSIDGQFDNFRVEQGTNAGTYKHAEGVAIDSEGKFLRKVAIDNIAIPDDDTWYYVKIAHEYSNLEVGLVDIDSSGNITGTGTFFAEVLRGQPNIPAKVKFSNASLNTGEYDVLEVVDDENTILSGVSFQAETDLTYVVVGSFTPDAAPSAGEKDIFNYDSAAFTLQTSSTKTAGIEFFLARVKNNGGVISIEDKRIEIYRDKADYQNQNIDRAANLLIGVEAIRYDDDFSTRDENILDVAWAFRSSNWTINSSTNLVTINGGLGGKWKDTTSFIDGDLDGWRLYTEDGKYSIINSSLESGGQINLSLGSLDPDRYANGSQQLIVCPNSDDITIHVISDQSLNNLVEVKETFPINTDIGRMKIVVYADPTASFLVKYSYGQGKEHDIWRDIPTDTDSGYLTEDSFDANGIQQATIRQTYTSHATNGYIIFQLNPNSFKKVVERVDLGDAIGVDYVTLDNGFPEKTIVVGVQKQMQIYQGILTLSGDHYISLETAGAVEGNAFVLKFENDTDLSGQSLQLVEDFINPGSPGTLILDFGLPSAPTDFWLDRAAEGNMWLHCEFDGTNWVVMPIASVTQSILDIVGGGSVLLTGSVSTDVQKYDADPTGYGGWDPRSWPDRQYVDDSITDLIDGAPATLDTLNELAAAIGDDPNIDTRVQANDSKVSNVTTNLTYSRTATTVTVLSSDGTDAALPEADTTNAGILGSDKWDEIVANTAKTGNANHTGDVTGSTALTIGADKVTYAKMQNIPTANILGRITAATGDVEDLTADQVKTMLAIEFSETATAVSVSTTNETAITIAIDDEALYGIEWWAIGRDTAATPGGLLYEGQAISYSRNAGGAPVKNGTEATLFSMSSGAGASFGIVANISGNNINLQVNGDTGLTVNWKVYAKWMKHS